MSEEEDNPIIKMLEKHGALKHQPMKCIEITEPITEANFKEFQEKLRSLVPPAILAQWDKEDEENAKLLETKDDK